MILYSQELHIVTEEHFAILTISLLLILHAYLSRCNEWYVIPVLYTDDEMQTDIATGVEISFWKYK